MPIDPMMLDATLGTFKNMAKEIEDKGLSGTDVDEMNAALSRLIQLGNDLDDFNEFNGTVMNENLYGKFSDHYGRALASESQAATAEGGYDDATLLKQTVDALKGAITEIRRSKQEALDMQKTIPAAPEDQVGVNNLTPPKRQDNAAEIEVLINDDALVKPILDLVDLGEQEGMTLPRFLKIQIEKGLDKAMEGSVVAKEGYEYDLGWAKANPIHPHAIKKCELKLQNFNDKAAIAPFNVPDSFELSLYNDKIDREFEPKIILWEDIKRRWESIIYRLEMWIIASSEVYISYSPWNMMTSFSAQKELAESIRDTYPGILEQELILLKRYHGLDFQDIFEHETFKWEVKKYFFNSSQVYIDFLKNEVFPVCQPCEKAPAEVIARFENDFHQQNNTANPEFHLMSIRVRDFYDSVFGAGRYEEKFDLVEPNGSVADPWGIE